MNFSEQLNRYIDLLGCTAKDLSDASGVSPATISRYRTGDRVPAKSSEHLKSLAAGIAKLSGGSLAEGDVYETLGRALGGIPIKDSALAANVSMLVEALDISNSDLARALSFDPSHISRILAGHRSFVDPSGFAAQAAHFIARRSPDQVEVIAPIIGATVEQLADASAREAAIMRWLVTHDEPATDALSGFLHRLDEFDLDEYIRAIHFDEMKVPQAPFQLPGSKTYTGIAQMKEAEIDFLKTVVLSKSMEPVTIYSDMPMTEMAKDEEFAKKWMFGTAMMLKKGLRLNMIHNVNRPFNEMMLGLESYVPLYMTGQVAPYYLPREKGSTFLHLIKAAGTVAMSGEAIAGHHASGRYRVTKSHDEVSYVRKRAEELLGNARPLMTIMRSSEATQLSALLSKAGDTPGARTALLSAPPLWAAPAEVLEPILSRSGLAEPEIAAALSRAAQSLAAAEAVLSHGTVAIDVPDISPDEYAQHPVTLPLSDLFLERDAPCSYDDYRTLLACLLEFAESREELKVHLNPASAFRNVQIHICEDRWALVSKNTSPAIHFLIEHPRMVAAFASFSAPIVD